MHGVDGVVEVRFVILARRPGQAWAVMWSAPDIAASPGAVDGVSQGYAELTWAEYAEHKPAMLEYRLARRTVVTADEVLKGGPDGAV